jgi:putative membrane protein
MRFSLPAVAAGGLVAVAALTVADIATSQAEFRLDDAAILSALEFTHNAEIELSELALKKGSSQELKDLATSFGAAHKAGKEEVKALGDKLQLKVGLNDDDPMKASAKENKERLGALEGKAFDKAWVDHQVIFHQNALESVKSMIPTATNEEVKAILNKTQTSVQGHLDAAKGLQNKIVAAQ